MFAWRIPPHPSRYSLDTLSRLGEGFYSCAVFMLFGRSIQQSQTDTNDQCTQPRPRGTLIADQRRAGEARPRGKAGSERRKACFHPGGSGFHLPRGRVARATPSFISIDFHVTHRFFVSFLVRPALLPCGKRGFRAAIYKITRPQPPAAAL